MNDHDSQAWGGVFLNFFFSLSKTGAVGPERKGFREEWFGDLGLEWYLGLGEEAGMGMGCLMVLCAC